MLRVGLTGGIGAGKSTVCGLLAQRGAVVIDADALAREVVEPGTPGLAAVVAALGPQVLTADGALDRRGVARLVFADEPARRRLEGVLHPLVRARAAEREAAAVAADPRAVVVHDVPLLVETGQAAAYDAVLVVDVDEAAQVQRLGARGVPEDEARRRIAAQTGRAERRAAATTVLDNTGSPVALADQVERVWRVLARQAAERPPGPRVPPS